MSTWYAAHIIMYVRFKDGNQNKYPIWENVLLFNAASSEEAEQKAVIEGKEDEGDDLGSFSWGGRPAEWVFGGIRKIMECKDSDLQPTSGTEITFSEFEVETKEQLDKLISGDPVHILYDA